MEELVEGFCPTVGRFGLSKKKLGVFYVLQRRLSVGLATDKTRCHSVVRPYLVYDIGRRFWYIQSINWIRYPERIRNHVHEITCK